MLLPLQKPWICKGINHINSYSSPWHCIWAGLSLHLWEEGDGMLGEVELRGQAEDAQDAALCWTSVALMFYLPREHLQVKLWRCLTFPVLFILVWLSKEVDFQVQLRDEQIARGRKAPSVLRQQGVLGAIWTLKPSVLLCTSESSGLFRCQPCPHWGTFYCCFGSPLCPMATYLNLPLAATADRCPLWTAHLAFITGVPRMLCLHLSWCSLPMLSVLWAQTWSDLPAQQLWLREGSWQNAHQSQASFSLCEPRHWHLLIGRSCWK
jgi:hypothetical protein